MKKYKDRSSVRLALIDYVIKGHKLYLTTLKRRDVSNSYARVCVISDNPFAEDGEEFFRWRDGQWNIGELQSSTIISFQKACVMLDLHWDTRRDENHHDR